MGVDLENAPARQGWRRRRHVWHFARDYRAQTGRDRAGQRAESVADTGGLSAQPRVHQGYTGPVCTRQRRAPDLLGVGTLEEVVGKTVFDFYSQDRARPIHTDDLAVMTSENPVLHREETLTDRKGRRSGCRRARSRTATNSVESPGWFASTTCSTSRNEPFSAVLTA